MFGEAEDKARAQSFRDAEMRGREKRRSLSMSVDAGKNYALSKALVDPGRMIVFLSLTKNMTEEQFEAFSASPYAAWILHGIPMGGQYDQ